MHHVVLNLNKQPICTVTPAIRGASFVFGDEREITIRGFAIAAEPNRFMRALKEGETYLIEDCGDRWRLHQVVYRGPNGLIVSEETIPVPKEEER